MAFSLQVDGNNNTRLEQQWAEVAELLNQEQMGVDSAGALLQNATLSAAINSTPEGFNQTIGEGKGMRESVVFIHAVKCARTNLLFPFSTRQIEYVFRTGICCVFLYIYF